MTNQKYYKSCTLGCKVNTYETQAVLEELDKMGYVESIDDKCDIYVINTCSVTATSDQKSRQKIRSAISENPSAIIFVMGCSSQIQGEEIAKIPGVSIIIGTSSRGNIKKLVEEYEATKKLVYAVDKDTRNQKYEEIAISAYKENTRAFLKVQDGCNNFCSYCVIPYTRGNSRSRKPEEVLCEVDRLVENNFKEIVITGIDTASYGEDFENKDFNFTRLIREILEHNKKLVRLRISSIEESQIDDDLIQMFKDNPRIAKHFVIPLQSGSESVLKRMNRKYKKADFLAKIKKIRKELPDAALAADVIVGFPGESEEEFEESMQFIKECDFDFLHVFPYSPRPGTAAAKMKNQVPGTVKKERVKKLINLGNELKKRYFEKFEGKEVEVIVETWDEKTKMSYGHSSNYLDVYFPSEVDNRNEVVKVVFHQNVK
jgi:threonylcarbamoyladenosine tRNA methylthiotransferase MtaB